MDKVWELMIITVPTVAAITAGIIGYFFKQTIKDIKQSIDILAVSVKELAEKTQDRAIENTRIDEALMTNNKDHKRLFEIADNHDRRINGLELWRGKLTVIHNKEHPGNQI